MEKTRKNTLKIAFQAAAKIPVYMDVLRFVGDTLNLSPAAIHSIYKDENEQRFYIKFIDETSFNQFTRSMEEVYRFSYVDCSTALVQLEVASSLFRYVRIFSLLPEVEDKEIAAALGKYGVIRQHVREKYPTDCGFVVFSGIRGVHMEISKELPASMIIGHCKARLYYEGLKNKCFHCKSEGHLKAECPKLAKLKEQQKNDQPSATGSYSQVLANANLGSGPSVPSGPMQMTTFPVMNNATTGGAARGNPNQLPANSSSGTNPREGNSTSSTPSNNDSEPMTITEEEENSTPVNPSKGKGETAKRPTVSSPENGSGSGEKPPKKQPFVQPTTIQSPIDALERRSRTKERTGTSSRSPRRTRSTVRTK